MAGGYPPGHADLAERLCSKAPVIAEQAQALQQLHVHALAVGSGPILALLAPQPPLLLLPVSQSFHQFPHIFSHLPAWCTKWSHYFPMYAHKEGSGASSQSSRTEKV